MRVSEGPCLTPRRPGCRAVSAQGFCQTCLVLLLVGMLFVFTYGLIRVSSDRVRAQALK